MKAARRVISQPAKRCIYLRSDADKKKSLKLAAINYKSSTVPIVLSSSDQEEFGDGAEDTSSVLEGTMSAPKGTISVPGPDYNHLFAVFECFSTILR